MLGIFSTEPVRFPEGFLWGSATAGHQIEGDNIHSGHWHWEQDWLKNVMLRQSQPENLLVR